LSIFLVPSQNSNTPLYSEVLRTKERTLIPSPYVVFTFGLAIESIKELGGALVKVEKKTQKMKKRSKITSQKG